MSKKIAQSSNTSKSSLTSSAAAEVVASNVDLLTEILVRVPAKSLIKFKSVSKEWLSLISDSQFSRNHTTRQNPPPMPSAIYFYSTRDNWSSINDQISRVSVNGGPRRSLPNFSFLDGLGPKTELLHSSNGLMLCSTQNRGEQYVVCNLTTQKFVVLPKPFESMSKYQSYLVFESMPKDYRSYLVFDPKKSPYYKVVVVIFDFDLHTTQLAVYSSESGSWKTTTLDPRTPELGPEPEAHRNGAIILISGAGPDNLYFRFDTDAEKLTTIRKLNLDTNHSKGEIIYFGECEGRCFLVKIFQYNATKLRVLEMIDRETTFRWTFKYIIDLSPLILPKSKSCRFKVISVIKVGPNESDLAVVLHIRGKIVQYNLECKTLKVLCDFTNDKVPAYPYMRSYHFIESLTPI